MSDAPPSASQDKFIVRLPDGMRDRIKAVAEKHGRSMNAEIVYTLEEAYPPAAELTHDQHMQVIRTLRDALYGVDLPEAYLDSLWQHLATSLAFVLGEKVSDLMTPAGDPPPDTQRKSKEA